MTDRPIIFSAPMVRALLAGRKTQTRRLSTSPLRRCAIGDRLYVREAWRLPANWNDRSPANIVESCRAAGWDQPWAPIAWEADNSRTNWGEWREEQPGRLRQGMHLPRPFSRLTLVVEAVTVEPLQAINEADAIAEGLSFQNGTYFTILPDGGYLASGSPVTAYRMLWDSLHPQEGGCWQDAPDVVALTFRVEQANIDRLPA